MLTFLESTVTVGSLFTTIGDIADGMFGLVSDVIDVITGNPVLLFTFLLPFGLLGIKILKKLISTRA